MQTAMPPVPRNSNIFIDNQREEAQLFHSSSRGNDIPVERSDNLQETSMKALLPKRYELRKRKPKNN